MRFRSILVEIVVAGSILGSLFKADAFNQQTNRWISKRSLMQTCSLLSMSSTIVDTDCGCEPVFSGKPSSAARQNNIREAIRSQSLMRLSGAPSSME